MDVNSYRIRSFVLAQDCLRIDGVRRLMAYSIHIMQKMCVLIYMCMYILRLTLDMRRFSDTDNPT